MFIALSLALTTFLLVQPADKPSAAPAQARPKDVSTILEGKNISESKMYFEMQMDGKPVGYQMSSLTPVKREDGVVYEYRAESLLTRPTGMRIDGLVIARLKRNFEPLSIDIDRQLKHPEALTRRIADHAQIGATQVALAHEDTAAPNANRSVPTPEEPFVFGMEFIIEAIDVTKNRALPIPELDPKEGKVAVYSVVPGRKTGEQQEMVLQQPDGSVGYRFTVDDKGRIESWAESTLPLMMKRCTEERFKEVRAAIKTE